MAIYYLATPLFLVLDLAYDAPLRAAAIPEGALRNAYYAATLACGVLCYLKPAIAPLIGIVESALNLLLLLSSVVLPIVQAPGLILRGEDIEVGLGAADLANFLISGTVLIASIHWQLRALRRQPRL